jgi:hypothetical protein
MQNPNSTIASQKLPVNLSEKDIARFWSKVDKNGPTQPHMDSPCWLWAAKKNEDGYGKLNVGKKKLFAHRIAWTIENGPIALGLCVLHICDLPSCTRVSHLRIGTHQENVDDMMAKGRNKQLCGDKHPARLRPERMSRGEVHGSAKLTNAKVIDIRARHAAGGITKTALALEFGVSRATLGGIINRKIWKHLQ